MGTVIAIMAGYSILNGQAFRALGEAAKWLQENLPEPIEDSRDVTRQ